MRALPLMLLLVTLAGCDYAAKWRDNQVATSRRLAQGSTVTPPAKPIEVPGSVRDALPLQDEWTILSYSEIDDTVSISALSESDPTALVQWMVVRLGELGYDSGDNPSRILEGVEFAGSGKFSRLYVKVELNTADQTLISLRATE